MRSELILTAQLLLHGMAESALKKDDKSLVEIIATIKPRAALLGITIQDINTVVDMPLKDFVEDDKCRHTEQAQGV